AGRVLPRLARQCTARLRKEAARIWPSAPALIQYPGRGRERYSEGPGNSLHVESVARKRSPPAPERMLRETGAGTFFAFAFLPFPTSPLRRPCRSGITQRGCTARGLVLSSHSPEQFPA